MAGSRRGHRARPHTADVILEAWGPDLAACCEEAVAALVDTYVDRGEAEVVVVERRHVELAPGPPESLLLELLEELIFTLDTAEAVPVGAEVGRASDGGVAVELLLADRRQVSGTGAVPKAISRSDFDVHPQAGGLRCRFLVDV